MSPTVAERREPREILEPVRLPARRERSFLGYVALYTRRAAAYAVYGLAILLAWLIVSPVLPDRYAIGTLAGGDETAQSADATIAAPPRPKSVPARIPGWAWSMHKWLLTAPQDRGARPKAAPAKLPPWFWDWRAWRLQLERH